METDLTTILKKVSAAGRIYYCKGKVHEIALAGGGHALVAETGLLAGDARRFSSRADAQREADRINSRGISNARWEVEEVRP